MKKKFQVALIYCIIIVVLFIGFLINNKDNKIDYTNTNKLTGTIIKNSNKYVTVLDNKNITYTFSSSDLAAQIGDDVLIKYAGILDDNDFCQSAKVISYEKVYENNNDIPEVYQDNGIFSKYYKSAYQKLQTLTLDEKIAQLMLVRYPSENQTDILKKYKFGGFIFYEKDFKDKTKDKVKQMINNLQKNSKIPLLTAVDEEGGSVVRISSNPNLSKEKFKSPSELYEIGGFYEISNDTKNKSELLSSLGINLNLAPVVDVSEDSNDYMYERTIKQNTDITKIYSETVIKASKNTGVSYTLKHFPGYGNNIDTHSSKAVDNRSYNDILTNDIPPFKSGIDAGAEAVLVSHNIVSSIDENYPASMSSKIHNLLRNDLEFTGIIITDDLSMNAVNTYSNTTIESILAGNDIIISTDYEKDFNNIQKSVKNGEISESQINKLAFRVLAWKYYKQLIGDN